MTRRTYNWPIEIREEAVRLAEQGLKAREIAEQLDVPTKTVQRWTSAGRERPRHDPETRARAVELFRSGAARVEIARELGVHATTVDYWIKDEAREKRAARRHSLETMRRVLAQIDAGKSVQEAAMLNGIPAGTIHNWLARRDDAEVVRRLYGDDRRARYAIHRPALALALSGVWR